LYDECKSWFWRTIFYRKHLFTKVKQLKEINFRKNASTLIEIDGGVTNKNAQQLVEAGADVLVAGNYVFKAQNPIETIKDSPQLQEVHEIL
jgi:ribulose-phosphate 3-epimerase